MNEFDDPQLENLLGSISGAYPDANVAYESVRGRVRQAKRRRAIVATTAACAAVFGVAVLAATGGGNADRLQPAGDLTTVSTDHADTTWPNETTVQDTTGTTGDTANGVDTSVAATVPGSPGSMTDNSASGNSGSGSGNSGSVSTPTSTRTGTNTTTPTSNSTGTSTGGGGGGGDTAPPGAFSGTFSSTGGSITVHYGNGMLTVSATNAAAGFSVKSAVMTATYTGRVEVTFESGTHTSRIRVELRSGAFVPDVQEG